MHRKSTVLESLFNKVSVYRPAALSERDSNTGVFLRILRHFQEHRFRTSERLLQKLFQI